MIVPTVGSRIGPYEIVALLGAGGMGEVYRARDARLHRDVAIKLLPVDMADDPDRLARFEREAQLLAALSHPHIAAIYGVEESVGRKALVLELVEGGTLADRLADGPLSIDEAVAIARQVADALEAAHELGIVHRDLKPANIALRPDGAVKILDFGLAKALDPAGAASGEITNSPTLTSPAMTRAGVVLGTAAYMSPEQARGRGVDRRADIWALGCVLYECLTARLAFHGDTVADTISQVLQSDPDWSKLPAGTPPGIRVLLHRCLTRDPRRRLRDIGEARIALDASGIAAGAAGDAATTTAPTPLAGSARRWKVLAGVASAAALVMVVSLVLGARNPPSSIVPIRAAITLPPGLHLDGYGPPSVALSRDGRTLAMIARGATGLQQLYVRGLDQGVATLVPSSESAEGPFFSPDGRWVAFAVGVSLSGGHPAELRKYSLDTRLTQRVCGLMDYFGGVWTRADTMIFVGAQPFGLWRVSASGGTPDNVVPRFRIGGKDVQKHVAWPELLPGEGTLALTDSDAPGIGQLIIADLQSRETTSLELAGAGARYATTGHLVYAGVDASLMAVRVDVGSKRKTGAPVALLPDIAIARNDAPVFAFSDEGTLAFVTGFLPQSRREPQRLIRRFPASKPLPLPFTPDLFVRGPVLSHDGRRVAASTWSGESWVLDLERGTRTKLPTPKFNQIYSLAWTEDGRVVLTATQMGSVGAGLYLQRVDRTPTMETVVPPGPVERFVFGGVLSGGALAYSEVDTNAGHATISSVVPGGPPRVLICPVA